MEQWAGVVRVSHMGDRKSGADNVHADRDQVNTIERYAAQHGATVEFMVPELSVSGGKPIEDRPSLLAAIEGVEAGRYTGIVVAYLSRLTRSRSGLEIWTRVEAAGGHVHCAAENLDTSSPSGRFVRDIHLANAVREREEHVDRFENLRQWATQAGVWQRRQVPTGYVRDPDTRKLIPSNDAPRVVKAFTDRAAGCAVVQIAQELAMTPNGVRHLLRNRVYLGELRVGDHVNPAAHPALVDDTLFRAAQTSAPRPPRSKTHKGPALLAGLIRCAGCGHLMTRGKTTVVNYSCTRHHSGGNCPLPASITAQRVDTYVQAVALTHLRRFATDQTAKTSELSTLRATHDQARQELSAYLEGVQAAGIAPAAFADGARQRQAAVDTATEALTAAEAAHGAVAQVGAALELWETLDVSERNHVLRGLLSYVAVRKVGRGQLVPVSDRVQVVAAGFGVEPLKRRGEAALGIRPILWLDGDGEHAAGVLSLEDPA